MTRNDEELEEDNEEKQGKIRSNGKGIKGTGDSENRRRDVLIAAARNKEGIYLHTAPFFP